MGLGRTELLAGWPMLLASFLGITAGISSLYFYSAGLFLKPIALDLNLSRGQASLGPLVGTLTVALASGPAGRVLDRFGPARAGLVGLLLLSLSFLVLGIATGDLATYLIFTGLLAILGSLSGTLVFTRLVVGSFVRMRGLALGIALTGTGIGGTVLPRLLAPYIATEGWRAGYLLLALIPVAAAPLVWWLLRRSNVTAAPTHAPIPWTELLRDPVFRLLAGIFFLAAVGVLAVLFHFVPLLTDAGLPPARAGAIAGVIGLSVIGGRLLTGFLLDRLSAKWVAACLLLVSGLGLIILALGGTSMAILGALCTGLAAGAEVDLIAFFVARYFPLSSYGSTYGGVYGVFLVGGALGPAAAGYLYDATGGYTSALLLSACSLFASALLVLRLPDFRRNNTSEQTAPDTERESSQANL